MRDVMTNEFVAAVAAAARHFDLIDVMEVLVLSAAAFIALLSFRLKSDAAGEKIARRAERAVMAMIYLGGIVLGGLVVVRSSPDQHRWGIVLAFLPYLLIMQHATFLRIVRRPTLTPLPATAAAAGPSSLAGDAHPVPPDDEDQPPLDIAPGPQPDGADEGWWRLVLVSAKATTERYFGPVSLAVRYGTAALAVLLVGLVAFWVLVAEPYILTGGSNGLLPVYALHPAQLGLAGAYVYVLVHLGRRNFTHDVTSGGAMWCAIVLAVGPILAVAIAYLLHTPGAGSPAGGSATVPAPEAFGVGLIYFMAGFSPRFVISFMDRVATKAWGAPAGTAVISARTLPATQVAGITPEIAERLEEEGITDVHGLATADPLRLIRNTNYDRREIVSWIAEAILIDVFPEHWKDFERQGITDAIDFVSLVYAPPYQEYHADTEQKMTADRDAYLAVLCGQLKLASEKDACLRTIHSVARRLVNDSQLRLIWVLHNHIADEEAEQELERKAKDPAHA